MSAPFTRVQQLAGRVWWLDRYRRLIAIASAAVIAPLSIRELDTALAADWGDVHAVALSMMLGTVVWWVIEAGLAGLTALWETEYHALVREGGLPRATVRNAKRRPAGRRLERSRRLD